MVQNIGEINWKWYLMLNYINFLNYVILHAYNE